MDLAIIRLIFVGTMGIASLYLAPFGLEPLPAFAAGIGIGLAIILFESRLLMMSLKRLIGAVIGASSASSAPSSSATSFKTA